MQRLAWRCWPVGGEGGWQWRRSMGPPLNYSRCGFRAGPCGPRPVGGLELTGGPCFCHLRSMIVSQHRMTLYRCWWTVVGFGWWGQGSLCGFGPLTGRGMHGFFWGFQCEGLEGRQVEWCQVLPTSFLICRYFKCKKFFLPFWEIFKLFSPWSFWRYTSMR
jgi:hypothetical protein